MHFESNFNAGLRSSYRLESDLSSVREQQQIYLRLVSV